MGGLLVTPFDSACMSPQDLFVPLEPRLPLSTSVLSAMATAGRMGRNPSSLHGAGQATRRGIEAAGHQVLRSCGAKEHEPVWLASCAEADALALTGQLASNVGGEQTASWLGWVTSGWTSPRHLGLKALLSARGVQVEDFAMRRLNAQKMSDCGKRRLISAPVANPFSGELAPFDALELWAKQQGAQIHWRDGHLLAFAGSLEPFVSAQSTLAVEARPWGGPAGVAALIRPKKMLLTPLWAGGGQQRGQRSGTVPRDLIAGFGCAAAERYRAYAELAAFRSLRKTFEADLARTWGTHGALPQGPRLAHLAFWPCPQEQAQRLAVAFCAVGLDTAVGQDEAGTWGLSFCLLVKQPERWMVLAQQVMSSTSLAD